MRFGSLSLCVFAWPETFRFVFFNTCCDTYFHVCICFLNWFGSFSGCFSNSHVFVFAFWIVMDDFLCCFCKRSFKKVNNANNSDTLFCYVTEFSRDIKNFFLKIKIFYADKKLFIGLRFDLRSAEKSYFCNCDKFSFFHCSKFICSVSV